ncbi:hypothetical protein REPUB_Repub03eG0261000 [Reevesia pubescens]
MDAQLVFQALTSSSENLSYFGLIIDDCKILAKDLIDCCFGFAKRLANQVAHTLAKVAVSESDQWV